MSRARPRGAEFTLHNVQTGIRRLLSEPSDLLPVREPLKELGKAAAQHQRLFEEYRVALGSVVTVAVAWWSGIIDKSEERGSTREQALRDNYRLRPAGPAASTGVVWIVRKYWLACDELNRSLPHSQRVSPEVFLLGWLVEADESELVRVLAGMPYWPIGLDANSNWV